MCEFCIADGGASCPDRCLVSALAGTGEALGTNMTVKCTVCQHPLNPAWVYLPTTPGPPRIQDDRESN